VGPVRYPQKYIILKGIGPRARGRTVVCRLAPGSARCCRVRRGDVADILSEWAVGRVLGGPDWRVGQCQGPIWSGCFAVLASLRRMGGFCGAQNSEVGGEAIRLSSVRRCGLGVVG